MKKVLSVLLAAAMVMGMSVSAFAAPTATGKAPSTPTTSNTTNAYTVTMPTTLAFDYVAVQRGSKFVDANTGTLVNYNTTDFTYTAPATPWFNVDASLQTNEYFTLEAGDILYFSLGNDSAHDKIPSNWKIQLKADGNVEGASFVIADGSDKGANNTLNNMLWHERSTVDQKKLLVKVVLADVAADNTVDAYFWVMDTKYDLESDKQYVKYAFTSEKVGEVKISSTELDFVYAVDTIKTNYEYVGTKGKVAVINFAEGLAYGEFKMWPEEVYTLSASEKYNKDLTKEYDTEVVVKSFNLAGAENVDLFFPMAKDAYQIVAVVDGELVPVEATYVEDHKFANGAKATGYLVEDAEYTAYAVIDATVEIEVEAEVEAPVEADKANPETGAADFVGAAVAMAVVSVAAAGALALKK